MPHPLHAAGAAERGGELCSPCACAAFTHSLGTPNQHATMSSAPMAKLVRSGGGWGPAAARRSQGRLAGSWGARGCDRSPGGLTEPSSLLAAEGQQLARVCGLQLDGSPRRINPALQPIARRVTTAAALAAAAYHPPSLASLSFAAAARRGWRLCGGLRILDCHDDQGRPASAPHDHQPGGTPCDPPNCLCAAPDVSRSSVLGSGCWTHRAAHACLFDCSGRRRPRIT